MRRRAVGLTLLNVAGALVIVGALYDLLVPSVPPNHLASVGAAGGDLDPRYAALDLAMLRSLGGCLLTIGATTLVLTNGPIRRGETWARVTVAVLVGVSEGNNAYRMFPFDSPWYGPLGFAVLAFAGPAARAADPAADEVKKLQGEWRAIEVELNGKKLTKDDAEAKAMRCVIKDNELTYRNAEKEGRERKKTFKLDPGKTPKEIDVTSLDGQEKGTTAACIYKLDGDQLTLCIPYFVKDPSVRPKEFKAGADDGLMLLTLERVKDK